MTIVLIEDKDEDYCKVSVPLQSTYAYTEPYNKTGEEHGFGKPLTIYKNYADDYRDLLLPYEFLP